MFLKEFIKNVIIAIVFFVSLIGFMSIPMYILVMSVATKQPIIGSLGTIGTLAVIIALFATFFDRKYYDMFEKYLEKKLGIIR